MEAIYEELIRWSEVWPLFIPLAIFIFFPVRNKKFRLLLVFLILSIIVSLVSTTSWLYGARISWLPKTNGLLYNVNSLLRTVFLGYFILSLKQVTQYRYTYYVFGFYGLYTLINFIFLEPPGNFSVHFVAAESIVLLILCLTYFLSSILDDNEEITVNNPAFMICTAIGLFESISFFINLFLFELSISNHKVGLATMKISQYSFILFYFLLGFGILQSSRKKPGQDNHLSNTKTNLFYE